VRAGAAAPAQMGFDDAQQDVQHGADRPRLSLPLISIGQHSRLGTDRTHWRTGNGGKTFSTRCAAVSAMRRALHEGHRPEDAA
jgi:hypothetical protein